MISSSITIRNKQKKTFDSAHCTRNFRPTKVIPSSAIFANELSASSLIANETYPTPLDTPDPGSVTTNADRTGAMSEKRVWRSVEVAV